VDSEDGSLREVTVSQPLLRAYKRNVDNYCAELRAFCLRYNMNYLLVANDTPVDVTMLRLCRSIGLVKNQAVNSSALEVVRSHRKNQFQT
jgi:hypothetical protein